MDLVNDMIASNEVSILPRTLQCMYIATDSLEHQLTTSSVKKYGLNMLGKPIILPPTTTVCESCDSQSTVSADDQVKAYIKKIMSQLDKWMVGGKISKLVIVITDKDTGEHVERWQFDVRLPSSLPVQAL